MVFPIVFPIFRAPLWIFQKTDSRVRFHRKFQILHVLENYFLVPHRVCFRWNFDFLAYKHVLRPQEAKKPVFKKKSVCVCVCTYVCMYVCNRWYFRSIVVLRPNFFSKFFSPKNVEVLFFFFNLDVIPHLFTRK